MKYLLAYSIPLITFLGIKLGGIYCFSALIYAFVCVPVMEIIMTKFQFNNNNAQRPPRITFLFDLLLYLNLPIIYSIMVFALYKITNTSITTIEIIGTTFSVGVMLGSNGINVAHELGHRSKTFETFIAKLLLIPSYYTHFYIEHNHGHHLNVATPDDASTAKLNQNLYQFWIQSITGTYKKAWEIQLKLNSENNHKFFSVKNDMLWLTLANAFYALIILLIFGIKGLIFSIFAGIIGLLLLETINYIEHYGLQRKKTNSGRYERVTEQHSWNSNHTLGRLILYELTRHSDHHAKSTKKYHTLENKQTSPQLAFGYPTSMVIAFIPSLWFSIMNKRVPRE